VAGLSASVRPKITGSEQAGHDALAVRRPHPIERRAEGAVLPQQRCHNQVDRVLATFGCGAVVAPT